MRRPHASPPAALSDSASPVSASPDAKPAALSPSERLFAQSERLFVCATQILDDAHAAQQVVAETLHLYNSLYGQNGSPPQISGSGFELTLDRLLVGLTIVRLKALPAPSRTGSQRESWPAASGSASIQGALTSAPEADEPGTTTSQLERTAQVLATLPVEPRIAVMLVVMQSRTVAEAAELLGATEEACTFYLNNGRKLLRRALQRDLLADDDGDRPSGLIVQPEGRTLHDLRRNKKAIARA